MSVQVKSDNSSDELRIDPVSKGARVTLYDFTTGNPVTPATDAAVNAVTAALVARLGLLGQANMAASTPVVLASNQSSIPVTSSQSGSWLVTANVGTTGGLALDATLTAGGAKTRITDGTNTAAVKAASTAAGATDPALVVAISPNNSVAVTGTFFQATQPISGTVTANAGSGTFTVSGTVTANASTNLNTSALALDATLTGGTQQTKLTDGTHLGTIKAASTAVLATDTALVAALSPNTPLPAGTNALGSVTVTGSVAATGSFFQATQPVSGTVTSNAGTGIFAVSAAALPLPSGAATETTLGTRLADATFTTRINTLGQKTMSASTPVVLASDQSALPVTGTFFQATQPVSIAGTVTTAGTVTANAGTNLNTSLLALDSTLTGGTQRSKITDGTNNAGVKAASTAAGATDPALVVAISPNNSVAVTGTFFQATQPVSGTVTANAGTGTFAISASALPLPTGASTETTLGTRLADSTFTGRINTLGQKTMSASTPVTLASDQSALAVTGTFFQTTQPVSGTVTGNQGTPNTATNGWPVKVTDGTNTLTMDSDGAANVSIQGSTAAIVTSVVGSATNVTLLTSNAGRDMASFYNNSTSYAYLKMGATASTSSFSVKIAPGSLYELPIPAYAGQIDCLWDTANGAMLVTEQQ